MTPSRPPGSHAPTAPPHPTLLFPAPCFQIALLRGHHTLDRYEHILCPCELCGGAFLARLDWSKP